MSEILPIDVVSDVVCPWCYVGKKRLEAALALVPEVQTEIRWRPYQLDPTIPPQGVSRREYMEKKFGSLDKIKPVHDRLTEMGRELGIAFNFGAIAISPNTLDAHRLIRWAHPVDRQNEMVERLFMAYWSEGKDVGDRDVLAHCAGEAGINAQQIRELLDTAQDVEETKTEIQHATNIGVTGVPTFILAQSYALVGAQSPAVLVDAITRVAKETGEA